MTARILCIEDEPGLGEDITLELEDAGYTVDLATDGLAGLAALARADYDLVLCDVQVPGRSGLEVLTAAMGPDARQPPPSFVMLTAYSDPALRTRCIDLGARELLVKPIDYAELLDLVAQELAR